MSIISVFAQGLFLQASLILALGSQNIFVLNSGLRRQRHLLVALISAVCDTLLVFVGVLGVATIFVQVPILKIALGVVGVGFLFFYGLKKLKEAYDGVVVEGGLETSVTLKQTVLTTLGFSLLNPHVILDTVVLIGGYSSKFPNLSDRFYFGAGASTCSVIWFFGLSLLASAGGKLLKSPNAMRSISLISGIILIALSIRLGIDVSHWILEP